MSESEGESGGESEGKGGGEIEGEGGGESGGESEGEKTSNTCYTTGPTQIIRVRHLLHAAKRYSRAAGATHTL